MPENSIRANTEITIQDYNGNKPVLFSNLLLNEAFLSVNSFSFSMRPSGSDTTTLNAIINFKKEVLGKDIEISFKKGDTAVYQFKGVIAEVNSTLVDNNYYEFSIEGTGLFGKVNETPEYHSFYKKKLDAIIDDVFEGSNLKSSVEKSPGNTAELHYTVQYNQTAFEFMTSLATRFGEWMYYDGQKLQFGKKPESAAIELVMPNDVANVNIRAHTMRAPKGLVGTDIFKSTVIEATTKEQPPGNDIIKAAETS